MGDCLKLSKDKRHRSSSSLSGVYLESTRSDRRLDVSASIPEVEDHFASAEARCDELQQKLDLVKMIKKKKKMKKRSMTRVNEQTSAEESLPFISVRAQPKKKVAQQAARMRRLEVPPNPARGYLDPAMIEQHRMIRGINQNQRQSPQSQGRIRDPADQARFSRSHGRGSCPDRDSMFRLGMHNVTGPLEVGCGDDDVFGETPSNTYSAMSNQRPNYKNIKSPVTRRHVPRETLGDASKYPDEANDSMAVFAGPSTINNQRRRAVSKLNTGSAFINKSRQKQTKDRLVELFKSNPSPPPTNQPVHRQLTNESMKNNYEEDEEDNFPEQVIPEEVDNVTRRKPKKSWHQRRMKRSYRYELPTVASQMKQAGSRYFSNFSNHTNIPFVVSKSTAPSHNIGVNIQQVLNGIKIKQPISGIPSTIAHHMGLGHVPRHCPTSAIAHATTNKEELNAIKLGKRMLVLPSYKYMSYSRLLNLYKEGDGMVPRFLRAISKPHHFYTSMYNLATNRADNDAATSKGQGGSQEAKQSLAEYANLYREYEQVEKSIKEGNHVPELERRKEDLSKELAARENHIRKVVQEYKITTEKEHGPLRASASTAVDYRYSTYKSNDRHE